MLFRSGTACASSAALVGGEWLVCFDEEHLDQPFKAPLLLATDGARLTGLDFSAATFVLGRETLRVTDRPGMAKWRERLFVTMLRNATTADVFFKLPPDRTIELGVQVEL